MEDIENKKARALFITSSIVIASQFLGFKLPSVLLSSLKIPDDTAAWRIWALVCLILGFQLWRLVSDPGPMVRTALEAAKDHLETLKINALFRALEKYMADQPSRIVKLDMPSHAERRRQIYYVRVGEVSALRGILRNLNPGVAQFSWVDQPEDPELNRVSATAPFEFTPMGKLRINVRAYSTSFLRRAAVQDLVLPVGVGVAALLLALFRAGYAAAQ
ncbi:hypothetical protein [Achromobacter ruhlandii]|uniref:hypothetical protein n=1 Tax=Achromobacter ruhlandii TaxID=72557 RepID=UPI0007BEC364|nr:hypothetical protein [Achromobacter ruhlandii]